MLLSRNKTNNVHACKPQFYYIKVGFGESKLYRHVFVMGFPVQQYPSVPNFQVGLSDHNIMKIAMQTKQLLSDEIEKPVAEKVKTETVELI